MPARILLGYSRIFLSVHAIVALSMLWRLFLAVSGLNAVHPDQSFQYFEQAHRLAFGYGYVPWEYRFGLRNWLLPASLAGMLRCLAGLGWDQPTFYVPFFRSLAVLLSMTSIYAVNAIGRNLYGPACGLLAALLVGFWHELDGYALALMPEVLGMYAILGALALLTGNQTPHRAVLFGVLLALAAALRLQYSLVAAVIAGAFIIAWPRPQRLPAVAAACAVVAMSGALDFWFWGTPFISYYNNFHMNIALGLSETFGTRPVYYYMATLTIFSATLFSLAGVYGLVTWRRHILLLAILAALLIPHSLIAHKERRFIILASPLLLLFAADAIVRLQTSKLVRDNMQRVPAFIVATIVFATVATSHFRNMVERDGRLDSMMFLSQREGVAGVLDETSRDWEFGGYYFLHRDVPLLTRGNATPVMLANPDDYFSHLVAYADQVPRADYHQVAQFGAMAVYEHDGPPRSFVAPQVGYRNKLNSNVDGRYTPAVRPWPPL